VLVNKSFHALVAEFYEPKVKLTAFFRSGSLADCGNRIMDSEIEWIKCEGARLIQKERCSFTQPVM
jgi:hypothetical protein